MTLNEVKTYLNLNQNEYWSRDYFLDKMDVYDCAQAIKDNI